MSIFGRDRQFMSDLELEEAGASLLHENALYNNGNLYNTNASAGNGKPGQRLTNANNSHNATNRRISQEPTADKRGDLNQVFKQLGEAYTTKKQPEMYSTGGGGNSRYSSRVPSNLGYNPADEDLIDMNSESMGPTSRGPHSRLSPVHSDIPSDLTEGTWNSRAGLVGGPSRTSTQNRPSGAPVLAQQRSQGVIVDRGDPINSQFNANHNSTERGSMYQRQYSERNTMPRPVTPPQADFDMGGYGGGMMPGDTLPRGQIEDDRRSHFSVATSVVSTIPLSTQPAATKTMSGLYALLLIMLGVAVTTGDIVSRRSYDPKYADYYSMYVFGMGTLAALYMCCACIYGKKQGSAPMDHHNGSVYIRIGAVVFCLGSLAHSAIILAETFQYQDNCYIYARLGSISLRALFQVTQLFVVLIHSKVCIQTWNGLARLVLAHVIAANFLMWFKISLKETLESIVVNVPRHYHDIRMFCERNYANSFTDMEEESTPILVPMAVAYCIISGTMLFTMWRNIGKDYSVEHREESCEEHEKQLTFHCREGVVGILGGSVAILLSISVLVLWIMFSNDRSLYDYLVSIYQGYNAAWLALLILLFPVAATALKRHKKQDHYHNSLNRPILILTTTGTFAYCILNIMSSAVIIIQSFSWVAFATLIGYSVHTVEVAIQTVYLLDGLRRCPRKKRKPPSKSFVVFFLLVNVSLWITIIFELKESALNPLQEDFYGIINWKVMLHFVGPIASLYRFHSVCCFLDVWKFAY